MTTSKTVIVPTKCESCGGAIEIECEAGQGFGHMAGFYQVVCPHCATLNHRHVPGDVVDVRRAGESAD